MSHTIVRSNSTTSAMTHLNSPIPYLFGGLALMLALIATALIILAWSYRRHEDGDDDDEKPANKVVDKMEDDFEPKVVVIMPGNTNPTHLARPKLVASSVPSLNNKSEPEDTVPRGDEQV